LRLSSTRLAGLISRLALAKRATEVDVLDVRQLTEVADYFVICTAGADIHCRAVADNLVEEMNKKEVRLLHREGYRQGNWILLDFVDVVVHIFLREQRQFYNLEGLWGDAPRKRLAENGRFYCQDGQKRRSKEKKKSRPIKQ
jgi:ribosome-associated protein